MNSQCEIPVDLDNTAAVAQFLTHAREWVIAYRGTFDVPEDYVTESQLTESILYYAAASLNGKYNKEAYDTAIRRLRGIVARLEGVPQL
jgi:hypothetical protein